MAAGEGSLRAIVRALRSAPSLLLPRVTMPLSVVFRQDPLLFWTFLLLWVGSVVPMFFTPFLPLSDMGIGVTMASLLWDTATGHGVAAKYYAINWAPNPYWTTYAIMAAVERVAGPLFAAKFITALTLLLGPLGVMRLLVTLRRSPRLALWAFLLGYDHNVYSGWMSLVMGLAYSYFIIAWMLETRSPGDAARVAVHTALLGLTHIQGIWLLMVAAVLLVPFGRPIRKRALLHAIVLSGMALTIGPWLLNRSDVKVATVKTAFGFEWHTPAHKIQHLFAYSLDNFVQPGAVQTTVAAFLVLALGPLLLGLLPRESPSEWNAAPLALVIAAGGLYMLLPFSISGPVSHWSTYPRYATVTLLFLLLVPAPRLHGPSALALLPGVLVSLWLDVHTAHQFAAFGKRTRPFLQIIDKVRPHASILPLVMDDSESDPDLKLPPYHQFFAYVTAFRKGYEGYLWDMPKWPLRYRTENMKPRPYWDRKAQLAFTMDKYGKHYDYVLVQGYSRGDSLRQMQSDPLPRPKMILQTGRWRLYEIER